MAAYADHARWVVGVRAGLDPALGGEGRERGVTMADHPHSPRARSARQSGSDRGEERLADVARSYNVSAVPISKLTRVLNSLTVAWYFVDATPLRRTGGRKYDSVYRRNAHSRRAKSRTGNRVVN